MKKGDLVKVKDTLREDHFGHIGVIVKERYNKYYVKVHVCGETRGIYIGDLELICKAEHLKPLLDKAEGYVIAANNNNQPYSC